MPKKTDGTPEIATAENVTSETAQVPARKTYAPKFVASARRLTDWELRITNTGFVMGESLYKHLGSPARVLIHEEDGKVTLEASDIGFSVNEKGRFGTPSLSEEFCKDTGHKAGDALEIGNKLPEDAFEKVEA